MTNTSDQLTSEVVTVEKVRFSCAPVDKNGEGISNSDAYLTCYQVKAAKLAPRPRVEVSTQFQVSRLELKKPTLLCVPSTKTLVP
jgi:hypothetical protein